MEETEEKFAHLLRLHKSRDGGRNAPRAKGRSGGQEVATVSLHESHLRTPKWEEDASHLAVELADAARTRREAASFAREEDAEPIRLPDIIRPQDDCFVDM